MKGLKEVDERRGIVQHAREAHSAGQKELGSKEKKVQFENEEQQIRRIPSHESS
jgi:hypothetical protein